MVLLRQSMTLNNQIGQQKFTFIFHKSQGGHSGLLPSYCPAGYGLPSQTYLMVQHGQLNATITCTFWPAGRERGRSPALPVRTLPEVAHTFATFTSLAWHSHLTKPNCKTGWKTMSSFWKPHAQPQFYCYRRRPQWAL